MRGFNYDNSWIKRFSPARIERCEKNWAILDFNVLLQRNSFSRALPALKTSLRRRSSRPFSHQQINLQGGSPRHRSRALHVFSFNCLLINFNKSNEKTFLPRCIAPTIEAIKKENRINDLQLRAGVKFKASLNKWHKGPTSLLIKII